MKHPVVASLLLACAIASSASAQELGSQEATKIAKDAYVYAYPALLEYVTQRQSQNYAEPTGIVTQSPFNQFTHAREFPPADFKRVVRPNQDTLYSTAGLDLKAEPIVMTVPATDHYFLLPLMSLWSDVFAVPGTRTTGRNVAKNFLITGPGWHGTAPAEVEVIHSPTRYVFILGRTQTNGPADYDAVHAVQSSMKLTPLSAWGKPGWVPPKGKVDPTIDMKTPPPVQVDKMDAATYFGTFAELLKDNPPSPFDYPILHQLERIGFKAGQPFDLKKAPADIQAAFAKGLIDGRATVSEEGKKASGIGVKGWAYTTHSGVYGTDYAYRAGIANCCLGENLPEDASYPSLNVDSDGKPFDGSAKYVLRFAKGQLPPVHAFWSVTVYDTDGYFIPNTLNRQLLGSRDNLPANADGSVDLLIQAHSPGKDKEANWLPVAMGKPFTLMMRLYSPGDKVISGDWVPPQVKRIQ